MSKAGVTPSDTTVHIADDLTHVYTRDVYALYDPGPRTCSFKLQL